MGVAVMAHAAERRALASAHATVESALTERVRQAAKSKKWPPEVVKELRVVSEDGVFHVVAGPEMLERALDCEFGSGDTSPRPVIRRFLNHLEGTSGADYVSEILASLVDAGLV